MGISEELLEILVCPQCKGKVYLNGGKDGLICERCRLLYEIREEIPIMLVEEAKPWQPLPGGAASGPPASKHDR
jgi:uncharacterized protein YbaR (Trm112 family)